MDSDNNPIQGSAGLSPTATADEPVLNIPSTASTAGSSNGNKSSSRASSIEALNWSDFEDEMNNDENSQINSNLLQSIHSSSESTSSSTSKLNLDHKDKSEISSTLMEETMTASTLDKETDDKKDEPFEHVEDLENVIRNRRRESACSGDLVTSYVSVASDSSSVPFDQMSNVPVLDDGPIWSKGMKHYRFEENRIINQKLTFCVLFSVVLAVGLGLGNLVAYNECEAEHRVIEQTCAKFDEKPIPTSQTVMPSRATASESAIPIPITNTKIPFNNPDATVQGETFIKPTASSPTPATAPVTRKAKPAKPMVDPDYKIHAQELSRVLKMLDELSRKIDQFENTTRQLGGIIMMRDEYVKPKSPKSKFLKLLDDVVHERGVGEKKKKVKKEPGDDNEDEETEADLNAEAEKVLDKIAEAVLNVMNSNLLSKKESGPVADDSLAEEETKLETKEVFPLDDDSLFIAQSADEKSNVEKKSRKFDNGKILAELKPSTLSILETHKFGEDSELELDYRGGDKRVRRESYDSLDSDVQDFDEFKEKHDKLHKNKDKTKSKPKKKRNKSKDKEKENRHAEPKKVKKEKKKDRDGKNVIKNWQTDRAKLREENRVRYEKTHRPNKRGKNWQIERDFAREKIRDESLVDEILQRPPDA